MTSSNDGATQKCGKRRRGHCIYATTYTKNIPKTTKSFIITVLLAAFAVVVKGKSQTLRHYRQQQHSDTTDLVGASMPSRIEQQRGLRKATEVTNRNSDNWSHDNNNYDTIINGLFQDSDDKELEETNQYAIGQHSNYEIQSLQKNDRSQKLVQLNLIETADIRKSDSINAGENNFTDGAIDYLDYAADIQMNSIDEKYGSHPILEKLFQAPEERDIHNSNYAIGNGEAEKEFQISLSDTLPPDRNSICRDCFDDDDASDRSVCVVPDNECCSNADCIHSDDICSNRNCIKDAYFRFTLKWVGDDDYDLFVMTPDGTEISYENVSDPVSSGKYETDTDQAGYGYHVENIYFPIEGGPSGVYRFYVRPFVTVGESDEWTVTVKENGNLVASESGVGSSESFFCKKNTPRPTKNPIVSPTQYPTKSPTKHPNGPPKTNSPTRSPSTIISPISTSPTVTPVEYPDRPPLGQPTLIPVSLPGPVPTVSTGPPQLNDDDVCDAAKRDECCVSSDCENDQDLCEQRTCIKAGNPRFTLLWSGYNSMDLFVITPDGVTISADNTNDMISGGMYEQDTNDQESVEYRVKNIFFPTEASPSGTYEYRVRSNTENGADTSWKIEIHDKGDLDKTHFGSGDSETFTHFHRNSIDEPERPKPEPPACSLINDECCIDDDCVDSAAGDLCVQRTCINEGVLRITLEWIGDDNLHLFVEAPANINISNSSDADTVSGGRHESFEQSTFGFNVKNVYFPSSGAPTGTYKINVNASSIEGVGTDVWTIRIYEDGEITFEETGFSDSAIYLYDFKSANVDDSGLCNFDSACADDGSQVCVTGICIRDGNPRFTLEWPEGSFYSLTVVTPDGKHISAFAPLDADSGGIFEGPTQQLIQGDNVESIHFPVEGGPPGLYSYYVTSSGGGNSNESWIATTYVNNEVVTMHSGSGSSDLFSFQFGGSGNLPVVEPPDQEQCDPTKNECCVNAECSSDKICAYNTCVKKGAPQFLLSWEGDYNLGLAIVTPTPVESTIAWQNPIDLETGGKFEEYFDFVNNRQIQNIYFAPVEGKFGVYPYYVHSFETGIDEDNWTVTIYIDGIEVSTEKGQGSSEIFFFDYSGDLPTIYPTMHPTIHPTVQPTVHPTVHPTMRPEKEIQEEEECDPIAVTDGECCSDSDCFPNEACTSRSCVDEGNPRFTLSWNGSNDLDLLVVTPLETVISYSNLEDPVSGGRFGEKYDQFDYGLHVENIYFPFDDGPFGEYSFYVRSFLTNGNDDEWTVGVYVNGEEQLSVNGTGSSPELTYTFAPVFP